MRAPTRRNRILISVALMIIIVLSAATYFYMKPKHDAIPVYRQLSEDVFKAYFHVGEIRYFIKGALYCTSLEAIKQYYDYMNARNLPGIVYQVVIQDCNYVSEDKVYAKLEEVSGIFAKVSPQSIPDAAPRWMSVNELARE